MNQPASPRENARWRQRIIPDRILMFEVPASGAPEASRCAHRAPVAQLDRALVSGTRGRAFESPQARHVFNNIGAY